MNRVKRITGLVLSVFFIPAIAYVSFLLAAEYRFQQDAPEADFPAPADQAEARAQDLEHFALFFELERSWTPESLGAARRLFKALQDQAGTMSDAAFEMAIARIVATADNAHSKIREYSRTPRFNRLPIRGHWFAEGYYFIRAYTGYEDLLGQQLVAIEGHDLSQVMDMLGDYIGGNMQTRRKYAPYLLESPALMHAAGLVGNAESMTVTLRQLDGTKTDVHFGGPFPPSSEQLGRSHQLLVPAVFSESEPGWSSVLDTEIELPTYLSTVFDGFHMSYIDDLNAAYVQFWTNNDYGDRSISKFCADALEFSAADNVSMIVLDHRFNGGGNMMRTQSCMEKFGHLANSGKPLYIAVSGPTFSAGMASAGFAKTVAGENAVIIGETMGDYLQSWGEDQLLRLPNSEIEIRFARGMHDLQNGCTDWKKCYWRTMYHDVRLSSNHPEIEAPHTFSDYLNLRDPVLEKIRATMSQ